MTSKQVINKIIRILTSSVITNLIMILILLFTNKFEKIISPIMLIIFLSVIPSLGYLISNTIKKFKEKGRDFERNLVIVISFISYILCYLYGLIIDKTNIFKFISLIYLLTVILLIIFNKLIRIKASGHASSIIGPTYALSILVSLYYLIPGFILFIFVVYSSINLKRHKLIDIIIGGICCIVASIISTLIYL